MGLDIELPLCRSGATSSLRSSPPWVYAPAGTYTTAVRCAATQALLGSVTLELGWRYSVKRLRTPAATTPAKAQAPGKGIMFKYHFGPGKFVEDVRKSFSCPFCAIVCHDLASLVCHCECSHHHFTFHVKDGESGVSEISVALRRTAQAVLPHVYSTSAGVRGLEVDAPEMDFLFVGGTRMRKKLIDVAQTQKKWWSDASGAGATTPGPDMRADRSRREGPAVGIKRKGSFKEPSAKKKANKKREEERRKKKNPLLERRFYHSGTLEPVTEELLDWDSDANADEEWELGNRQAGVEAQDGVTWSEKQFIRLWNNFVHKNVMYGDLVFAAKCLAFAKANGLTILQQNLRTAFLMHLLAMWEWGLLAKADLAQSMAEVDKFKNSVDTARIRQEHESLVAEEEADLGRERAQDARRKALGIEV